MFLVDLTKRGFSGIVPVETLIEQKIPPEGR